MRNVINHISVALIGLSAAVLPGLQAPLHAQIISNIAQIQWDAGADRVARNSNQIDIIVDRTVQPPIPAVLTTYHYDKPPGAESFTVPVTTCRGAGGDRPIVLDGAFAGTPTAPASLVPTTQIRAGEPLIVALQSPTDDRDPLSVETITVQFTTPSGDAEILVLTESGVNSGRFVGMVRTAAIPPEPVRGDCVLSVRPGETLILSGLNGQTGGTITATPIEILIDPFGIVFDSGDGVPVAGSRVTLVDAVTRQPAVVFGDDGRSIFPSSVITGSTVTDSSGVSYSFPTGDYRFPFARAGNYILIVEPPPPYTAPSQTTPADIATAGLLRPDGEAFVISPGSYGLPFTLNSPAPVRIDIPVDRPGGTLVVRKSASTQIAVAGDAVQYKIIVQNGDLIRSSGAITVTDTLPTEMRLKKDSVRSDGIALPYAITGDGRTLTIPVARLSGGASRTITYILEVRPDARPGASLNRASASDTRGTKSAIVDAAVTIQRDGIGDRLTIIGRITDGGCIIDQTAANGVRGVRVMLEDGSYAVTDDEGRYHFEGVLPGLHVVQMDESSLPSGQIAADCARNARSAGSAISRFVEGQGGALLRVDFRSQSGQNRARVESEPVKRLPAPDDQTAAGATRDWFTGQTAEIGWLFPEPNHNPRTKAVRVAIKHLPGQTVKLFASGVAVNPMSFDGAKRDALDTVLVSLWRAVEIGDNDTVLTAEIYSASGVLVETLTRTVHFANSVSRGEIVPEKSVLIADGVTRPVIAVRMIDRANRPARHGITGDFDVSAPYFPAVEADALAAKTLTGLERGKPVWRIDGDEGIAYIELEPTTASGGLSVNLPFREGETTRTQRIDLWLTPGNRPWTIVGFAAGTAGFNTLSKHRSILGSNGDKWLTDGRIALYAKGRIKGKWLLTLAYDSDKKEDETRFGGIIDPTAYYTIYADRTERRYDAASTRKLYLKLERPQFYALFGDYETGLNDTQLLRYSRAFNGVKAEYRSAHVSANAFAADTPYRHRREEIQGNGLSGPYALGARDILANSERIVIEVRDRLRSNLIIETRALIRHIDYDIDYRAGTLRFREPVLSRSSGLDPQFIIADYEVDGVAQRVTNAGGRVTWTNNQKNLIVGATAIHDENDAGQTNAGGIDVRFTPTPATEIRAEVAASNGTAPAGQSSIPGGTSAAWLVEAEHHGSKFDILGYAREQQAGYGVGQTNGAETGTRKFGVDGRMRVTSQLSISGSAWVETYLGSRAERQAGRLLGEYRSNGIDLRSGITIANDRLADGRSANSTIAQFGAAKRFFDGKLELDAQTEVPINNDSDSIDFPARHKLGARVTVSKDITLVGSYELAKGNTITARTARIGVDVKPWAGARIAASANQQSSDEYGPRSYAAFGFAQSVPINRWLTVDFTLDGNKTLNNIDRSRVLAPGQPVASGGFLGSGGVITEDFTAVTFGASYRADRWALAGRAEIRASELGDRKGLTISMLRQIGEGRAFGGSFNWFKANLKTGVRTDTKNMAISLAHRPDDSRIAFLNKLELREDSVSGATLGGSGPIGGAPLLVSGNASSKRVINSFSVNWSPQQKREDGTYLGRSELSLFWGTRYVFDKFDADTLKGWSNTVGADIRFDLSSMFEVGAAGTVRQSSGGKAYAHAGGPSLGVNPFKNGYVSLGYNVVGYSDRDFEDSRYTRSGPYVTLRLKFDQNSFAALGLGRK